jgi:hypothetical protein
VKEQGKKKMNTVHGVHSGLADINKAEEHAHGIELCHGLFEVEGERGEGEGSESPRVKEQR